jgi:hypothetical protein
VTDVSEERTFYLFDLPFDCEAEDTTALFRNAGKLLPDNMA